MFGAALCASSAYADDIGAASRGVVRVIAAVASGDESSISFGTGFAISPHHIITNAHVVEDVEYSLGDSIVAIVPAEGSRALRGTIIAFDRSRDLAVVDVGEARLEPLAIYSGPTDSGLHAAALGYPGNVDLATARSMYDLITPSSPVRSEGNISSERSIDGRPALLHTAAISRGNSGGPLVDECGRVLGVNTYTTRSGSGDAPFGFAIVSQELMTFLRDQGEKFQQIGTPCVSMAELAQHERQARESAARTDEIAQQRAVREEQARTDVAKAEIQDLRQNHVMGSVLLGLLSIVAGAIAAVLFFKDQFKAAASAAALAAAGLVASSYAFLTRPALAVRLPEAAQPIVDAAALSGQLLCQVNTNVSRVTVSSTDDLAMSWNANGCMNNRTQYVQEGTKWRRILVPNVSETVFVQDFDPAKGEYISTRYLLSQTDMERLRAIRGGSPAACSTEATTIQQLRSVTDQLEGSLPATPNEKLVYNCRSN